MTLNIFQLLNTATLYISLSLSRTEKKFRNWDIAEMILSTALNDSVGSVSTAQNRIYEWTFHFMLSTHFLEKKA